MRWIMIFIFEQITSPLEISNDILINYIVMLIIGAIAYKVAFFIVGETDFRGDLGSFLHWITRIFVFVVIWVLLSTIINIIKFIINVPIQIWVAIVLLWILYKLVIISKKNPNSF